MGKTFKDTYGDGYVGKSQRNSPTKEQIRDKTKRRQRDFVADQKAKQRQMVDEAREKQQLAIRKIQELSLQHDKDCPDYWDVEETLSTMGNASVQGTALATGNKWAPCQKTPMEVMEEVSERKGWKLQFQLKSGSCYDKSVWNFDLIILDRRSGRVLHNIEGSNPSVGQYLAQNKICARALFRATDWNAPEILKEPFRSDFMRWRQTKRESAIPSKMGVPLEQTLKEVRSVESFNTSFSCATADVQVSGCSHYNERAQERKALLQQQQICLKYGKKTTQDDGRVEFQLGSVKIIQAGPNQGDTAITFVTGLRNGARRTPTDKWKIGDVADGVVAAVFYGVYGFIETKGGSMYFHYKNTIAKKLPFVGDVVTFIVGAGTNPHVHPFQAQRVALVKDDAWKDDAVHSWMEDIPEDC